MKKILNTITLFVLSCTVYVSCSKTITERTENIPPLTPVSQDLDAGSWKPVLLSRPDSFAVAPPPATNSPAYIADLNEIKGYQNNFSSDNVNKIHYWAAGGVL